MKYLRQFSMRTSNSSICNLRVLRGVVLREHHTTISANTFTPEQMKDGLPKLDGSSIVGFTSIHDSDLILKPDPNTFALDNRKQNGKIVVDVYWGEDRGRLQNDPRGIAQRAEEYVKHEGFDASNWGPEVDFLFLTRYIGTCLLYKAFISLFNNIWL